MQKKYLCGQILKHKNQIELSIKHKSKHLLVLHAPAEVLWLCIY